MTDINGTIKKNYLVHHGIKGQKWGVRRYQNEDGSLTDAGRDRYSADVDKARKSIGKAWDKEARNGYKHELDDIENSKIGKKLTELISKGTSEAQSQYEDAKSKYQRENKKGLRAVFRPKAHNKKLAPLRDAMNAASKFVNDESTLIAHQYVKTLPKNQQELGSIYAGYLLGYDW